VWSYETSRVRLCPIFEAITWNYSNYNVRNCCYYRHLCTVSQERRINYLNFLAIDFDGFHRKINTNGVALVLGVRSTLEPLNDTCFAGAAVTDKHDFEQKVKIVFGRNGGDSRRLLLRRRWWRAGRGRTGRLGHGDGHDRLFSSWRRLARRSSVA